MNEYKRLTRQNAKGEWVAEAGHFCVYHDDKSPSAADMMHGDIVNRLAELEGMTEKIGEYSLPVGIGGIVYYVYHDGGYTEVKIKEISFKELGVAFWGKSDSGVQIGFILSDFGSCVFLTEEEAQKKSEEWSR